MRLQILLNRSSVFFPKTSIVTQVQKAHSGRVVRQSQSQGSLHNAGLLPPTFRLRLPPLSPSASGGNFPTSRDSRGQKNIARKRVYELARGTTASLPSLDNPFRDLDARRREPIARHAGSIL